MTLLRWPDGDLIKGPTGHLTNDPNCCICEPPPPPIQPCCDLDEVDTLVATIESEECPELDGTTWELTGAPGGEWEGSIPDDDPSPLRDSVKVRCNPTDPPSGWGDLEVYPDLSIVYAPCGISPYDVWLRFDEGQCTPLRLVLHMQVIELVEGECEACNVMPGNFDLVITLPALRTTPTKALTSHRAMKAMYQPNPHTITSQAIPTHIPKPPSDIRTPGTFLRRLIRHNYPGRQGCSNDYRELDKFPLSWWNTPDNMERLHIRLAKVAASRNIRTNHIDLYRLVSTLHHIANQRHTHQQKAHNQ